MANKQPQTIEQIIHSFQTYGLGDIRHNKERTISVAILAICFIDQLASFIYRMDKEGDRWEQFVIDYMPTYAGLSIYNRLRNDLIHSYSGGRMFALTNDPTFIKPFYKDEKGFTTINTNQFVEHLERGFIEYEKRLRKPGSAANYLATTWSIDHPVLTHQIKEFPEA